MVMTLGGAQRCVAVLIDAANEADADMGWILATARRLGRLVVANAYGNFANWRYLRPAAEKLFLLGVRLVHCPAWSNGSGEWKDASDETMIEDIHRILEDHPEVTRLVVCTGDGHYLPVVHAIRRAGREVIVVTPPTGGSRLLKEAASRHLQAPPSGVQLPLDDGRSVGEAQNLRPEVAGATTLQTLPASTASWARSCNGDGNGTLRPSEFKPGSQG